ncbi:MAG TPA: hypothetical protein VGD37_07390 [Kofleriaceae bacterium]|jgi:hypothetical protein
MNSQRYSNERAGDNRPTMLRPRCPVRPDGVRPDSRDPMISQRAAPGAIA